MAETTDKTKKPTTTIDDRTEHSNSLTFDERVIRKIAGMAASEVPGILAMSGNFISGLTDMFKNADDPTKGITVEVGKKQVAVDMKVVCEYGKNIPNVFQSIVDGVSTAIKEMTGLDVVEVNVHVFDVLTADEFNRKKKIATKTEMEEIEELEEVETEVVPSRVE